MSVSIASNIPGFEHAVCVVDADLESLLKKMEEHLASLQMAAVVLTTLRLRKTYTKTQELITEYNTLQADGRSDKTGEDLQKLLDQLDEHVHQLPVIGFNSGKYDMHVIKQKLAKVCSSDSFD